MDQPVSRLAVLKNQPVKVWLPQLAVFASLAAALAVFIVMPFLAYQQLAQAPASLPVRFSLLYVPYFIGVIYLGSAVWSFVIRRTQPSGQLFAFFLSTASIAAAGLFDFFTGRHMMGLWLFALAFSGASVFNLAFYFPRGEAFLQRLPWLPLVGFGVGAVAALNAIFNRPVGLEILLGLISLELVFTLIWMSFRRSRMINSVEREQIRLVVLSGIIAFGPLVLWLIFSLFLPYGSVPPALVLVPLVAFPIVVGYTVQRYRLMQADYVLSRGTMYGLLSLLVAIGYALLVAGAALVAGQLGGSLPPLLMGLIFFLLALAFNPLREQVQHGIDSLFLRGQRAYQERLQTFTGELTRSVELDGILKTLRQYVDETLQPGCQHQYIFDAVSEQYSATRGSDGAQTSDLRFTPASALVNVLSRQRLPLVLPELQNLPESLQSERARLSLLGALVFVPLPGRERLSGWIGLGPRLSGEPYTTQELSFLESLCDQSALAIERAQVLANMENRVRQMNVLARVAQGVNITLTMDDILELIYAQTTQVIPADEFHIMLYDAAQDTFQYAFYLEGDERLSHLENKPVPGGQTLEQEAIHQRRVILTDDYNRECQRRGIQAARANLYSWLAVPLNTGAETIGALSLGSGDTRVEYTEEQQNLAQSIADQVAGAIVKARLLQETERRALQLTTLNEVTRQLTSTLELEPLLHNILQSAVDILSCEAGSLLLVDETTEEMVFRVAVGPVAGNLTNRRMPPGTGVVGKAVKSRAPIIVNDVSRFPEWFARTDQQTGFITHALLVIPLSVKDRVIGVIEVLNKRDGSGFSQDDEDLLSAFAAQAAVAIENARLYTMTDQALAARVEELSVMQRIDRELNTSLDTTRAMRITLEWAMRQSAAQAGFIGILQEPGLKVMASQGYTNELEPYAEAFMPVEKYALDDAVKDAVPLRRILNSEEARLLTVAQSQVVIPIRRETTTIGVLLLESNVSELCPEETMNFLARLSDHASIAIFNAQLYAAVQAANLAKSEFVSFVAHELKNPMTSVKGYTELLAAGAVGPINEAQGNFLHTIRANIERMNTLVSDLNDSSKIEVGRLRLDYKAISIVEVVEGVIRSTRRQLDEKQQTLTLELPIDLPPAWADQTRIEQVLVNLVSNAHKYTQAGGQIWLCGERCPNQWDLTGAPEVLHIWVRDNGIGISDEDQKKIFQKFFRSEDPKTREAPGTGLGLNITRSLVEMQGGRIWFESEFRKGTIFHFTVPVAAQ